MQAMSNALALTQLGDDFLALHAAQDNPDLHFC